MILRLNLIIVWYHACVTDEDRVPDCEYIERVAILADELRELAARLGELVDDMVHTENVARVQRDWDES